MMHLLQLAFPRRGRCEFYEVLSDAASDKERLSIPARRMSLFVASIASSPGDAACPYEECSEGTDLWLFCPHAVELQPLSRRTPSHG